MKGGKRRKVSEKQGEKQGDKRDREDHSFSRFLRSFVLSFSLLPPSLSPLFILLVSCCVVRTFGLCLLSCSLSLSLLSPISFSHSISDVSLCERNIRARSSLLFVCWHQDCALLCFLSVPLVHSTADSRGVSGGGGEKACILAKRVSPALTLSP